MKKLLVLSAILCTFSLGMTQTNYADLHNKLIKFYGYQRAGLKTGSCNNLNSSFTNASHGGDNYNGNPLDGGWYDAGDYIKFGMNLSYSVYCLLKGYDIFPTAYDDNYKFDHSSGADGIPDVLNQAKFATDYICRAVIDDKTVILDVGSADDEHGTWGVKNPGGRNGTLCNGGDIPATYAACLALMSTLYAKYDQAYATQCLTKAKQAFTFAKNQFAANKNYCTPQKKQGAALYDYPTVDDEVKQQITDRMVAAGVELYRATKNEDPVYRAWAQKNITDFYNCIGYAYIGPLAAFEVWRQGLPGGASALTSNITFLKNKIKTTGVFKDVYQNSGWGTARDVGSAAFEFALGYVTSSNEASREDYLQYVKNHVNWLTGAGGGQSYICGVNGGPSTIHYRTTNYAPVPGAVVSGPDGDGTWQDNRDAKYVEVAIDYNAGIAGAVAFLRAIENPGENVVTVSNPFTATPDRDIDFASQSVAFSCTFSKAVACTITINGAYGTKVLSSNGSSINATWDGSADKGFFLGGEIVKANIKVNSDVAAFDLLYVSPVSIEIALSKKVPKNPGDSLIDNFDDSDSLNERGGIWKAFGTGTGLKATSFSYSTIDGSMALQLNGNVATPQNTTYSGIKTSFNANGDPISFGSATSVIFSMKSNMSTQVYCELEQPTITDGAYYSAIFPVATVTNTYRLNFAEFTQPDWKTTGVPLNLDNITALRFTVYDSTGMVKLYLDDVFIEDFSGSSIVAANRQIASLPGSSISISNEKLNYVFSAPFNRTFECAIYNMSGRVVVRKSLPSVSGSKVTIPLSRLPSGVYSVRYSLDGVPAGESMRFTKVQ